MESTREYYKVLATSSLTDENQTPFAVLVPPEGPEEHQNEYCYSRDAIDNNLLARAESENGHAMSLYDLYLDIPIKYCPAPVICERIRRRKLRKQGTGVTASDTATETLKKAFGHPRRKTRWEEFYTDEANDTVATIIPEAEIPIVDMEVEIPISEMEVEIQQESPVLQFMRGVRNRVRTWQCPDSFTEMLLKLKM